MQVRLGVQMSGVRLQAAGSTGAASAAVLASQPVWEKAEPSLTLWSPAPGPVGSGRLFLRSLFPRIGVLSLGLLCFAGV